MTGIGLGNIPWLVLSNFLRLKIIRQNSSLKNLVWRCSVVDIQSKAVVVMMLNSKITDTVRAKLKNRLL